MRKRFLNLAISLDQFLLCWLSFGYYDPDETLSSVAWQWHVSGKRHWPKVAIDWLFSPLEEHHCRNAFLSECRLRNDDE